MGGLRLVKRVERVRELRVVRLVLMDYVLIVSKHVEREGDL